MSTRFTVNLPDDVMLRLTEEATAERRTPKAQAEHRLVQLFSPPRPTTTPADPALQAMP